MLYIKSLYRARVCNFHNPEALHLILPGFEGDFTCVPIRASVRRVWRQSAQPNTLTVELGKGSDVTRHSYVLSLPIFMVLQLLT